MPLRLSMCRKVSPVLLIMATALCGCRRDMQDQPKYLPLQASHFFIDGRASRPIPAHTIARDELNDNDAFHTGSSATGSGSGSFLASIPVPITSALLDRGHQRYDIYCSP